MVFSLLLFSIDLAIATDLYEARIFEDAPKLTPLTLNWPLERRLQPYRSCFGQLEMTDEWIEFDSDRFQLLTAVNLSELVDPVQQLTLHLLCPSNEMHSIPVRVHISRRNRHTPQLLLDNFELFVPIDMPLGVDFFTFPVTDQDTVVYNSLFRLSIVSPEGTTADKFLMLSGNGTLSLKTSIADLPLFRPLRFQIIARDFGSPQLFSMANVSVVPVTISQVREIWVNVANDAYQVFEWQKPQYGNPERYRIRVSRKNDELMSREVNATEEKVLLKMPFQPGPDYSLIITAIDSQGETPSDPVRFAVIYDDLECAGQCDIGGRPACRHTNGDKKHLVQFRDHLGPHCVCFNGYSGVRCHQPESCAAEEVKDAYGKIAWPVVVVNGTATTKCPFGPNNERITRRCTWVEGKAVWEMNSDLDLCRKQVRTYGVSMCPFQSSVLVHLGVIGNYAESAKSVTALDTVTQFVDQLLSVEAFDPRSTDDFDAKVAEHLAHVFDLILSRNWTSISGNITQLQLTVSTLLDRFVDALPVPLSLESAMDGLHLRVFDWLPRVADASNSGSCFLNLPPGVSMSIVRMSCMRNASLYSVVDSRNPLLQVKIEGTTTIEKGGGESATTITFGLKPYNASINYTCVFYDTLENAWSTRGMDTIDRTRDGYVVCTSDHLSVFGLLPESMFRQSPNLFHDLYSFLPAITSFLVIVCSLFLLLVSLLQRVGAPQDPSLPVFLFLVLLVHVGVLLLLVSHQLPFTYRTCHLLRFPLQFIIVAVVAAAALLSQAIHLHLKAMQIHAYPHTSSSNFIRCCSVFLVAIVIPALLTTIVFFLDPGETNSDETTCMSLSTDFGPLLIHPAVFFLYVLATLLFSWWSMCRSRSLRLRQRLHSTKELQLNGMGNAALSCVLFVFAFTAETTLLHVGRGGGESLLLAGCQLLICFALFAFFGFLMRAALSSSSTSLNSDGESPTRSLERKRDISRDILPHNNGCCQYQADETLISPTESLYSQNGPMVSVV